MPFKTTINYSPNFSSEKRQKKHIRFIILHYTGMKSEKAAIQHLSKIQSEVSTNSVSYTHLTLPTICSV